MATHAFEAKRPQKTLILITVFVYRDLGGIPQGFLTDLSLGPLRRAAGLVEDTIGAPSRDEVIQVRCISDQSVGKAYA